MRVGDYMKAAAGTVWSSSVLIPTVMTLAGTAK